MKHHKYLALLWLSIVVVSCKTAGTPSSLVDADTASGTIPEVNTLPSRDAWIQFLATYRPDEFDNDYLARHADWVEENYQKYHQINGISYMASLDGNQQPMRHYSVDAAIYSGYYTAAAIFRFRVEPSEKNLQAVLNALRGTYLLTHGSGIAGLTSKAIIPMSGIISEFDLPEHWLPHLKKKQEMYEKRKQQIKINLEKNQNKSFYQRALPTTHLELMADPEFADPQPPTLSSPEVGREIRWRERIITAGQSYIGPDNLLDPLYMMGLSQEPKYLPQVMSYQRTTKDQMTGVFLALAVALKYLEPAGIPDQYRQQVAKARTLAKFITWNVYKRIHSTGFELVDQNGIVKTSSRHVKDLLKINLLQLAKTVASENKMGAEDLFPQEDWEAQERDISSQLDDEYGSAFDKVFLRCEGISAIENSVLRYKNYYKWNLRFTRIYAALILEKDQQRGKCYDQYMRDGLWPNIKDHRNTMFNLIYNLTQQRDGDTTDPDPKTMQEAMDTLRSLSVRPLKDWSSPKHLMHGDANNSLFEDFTNQVPRILSPQDRAFWGMFIWASEPFYYAYDYQRGPVKDIATTEAPGLDYLFAYWLGRFYYPDMFLTQKALVQKEAARQEGIWRRRDISRW